MEVGSSSLPGTTCESGNLLPLTSYLYFGGLAQLARAPALQAGGQRFESVILHQVYGRPLKFNVSCFMFNVLEIFDILTHKTVSKTLFLETE